MANGWIKKVGVTPTRGNGFIIDSFHTNDDKRFNAPSIRAVEERTDNNLLYDGCLMATANYAVGWRTSRGATFSDGYGIMLPNAFNGYIYSPRFTSEESLEEDPSQIFSATVVFSFDNSSSETTATCENMVYNSSTYKTFYSDNNIVMVARVYEGKLELRVENNSGYRVNLKIIKLEPGSTATPVFRYSKEIAVDGYLLSLENEIKYNESAIQERDNNVVFNGRFTDTGAYGWDLTVMSGSPYASPGTGVCVPPNSSLRLKSPYFFRVDNNKFYDYPDTVFSITVEYCTTQPMPGKQDTKTAKLHGVYWNDSDNKDIYRTTGFFIRLDTLLGGGKAWFTVANTSDTYYFIVGIKIEVNSYATPFNLFSKDIGIAETIRQGDNKTLEEAHKLIGSDSNSKMVTLVGNITTTASGEGATTIGFPSGFNINNTQILAFNILAKDGYFYHHKVAPDGTCTRELVILGSNGINLYMQADSSQANATLAYRLTLLRFRE